MMRFRGLTRAFITLVLTLALALLVALAVGALADPSAAAPARSAAARTDADFHWRGVLAEGKTIEIHGINGDIRAERAPGSEAEVSATKKGKRSDPSRVRIEAHPHRGGVVICAIYPNRRGKPTGRCGPGGARQSDTGNNDVRVDFHVLVPAGVRLVTRTVNGGIEAEDLDSEIDAQTVNGGIQLATLRSAAARTVNGGIEVALGLARGGGPLEFETVNGSIRVEIPEKVGVTLRASTVNGEIVTDLPITVSGRIGRCSLQGAVNGGGRQVRLSTVNGSIRVESAKCD